MFVCHGSLYLPLHVDLCRQHLIPSLIQMLENDHKRPGEIMSVTISIASFHETAAAQRQVGSVVSLFRI